MIVVDTAVWVPWLASHDTPHVCGLEEALAARDEVGLTPIILTEVLQGIRSDR